MFGSHLSVAGGLVNALTAAGALRLDTVQVFTKNQRQWSVPPLDAGAAREWLTELKRLGWADRTVSHDSYLINLASPDDSLWERSIAAMREEIERAAALSIPFLVSHPGAHMIKDGAMTPEERIEAGLRRIARAYKRLLKETKGFAVTVCLENTAGGGTTLGRTFEELSRLRELIVEEAGGEAEGRIGFCVDTCHALAAGYDIAARGADGTERSRSEGEALGRAMLERFDELCGIDHLRVLHLNDSLGKCGSRVDRHAHIGRGEVSLGAFSAVVNHRGLDSVPMILETPKEDDDRGVPMDTVNVEVLRSLAREKKASAGRTPARIRR
ncbi:MAG: deoxyribonuclease IV [Phycisphaerae bacterium]|nr:deoxyribonuclease IV [Phycisphaerae bacterium]